MEKSQASVFRQCRRIMIVLAVAALISVGIRPVSAQVLVFAASSASGALEDLAESYSADGLGDIRVAFASSSALARQIAAGAPADIFISANPQWMNYLAARNALVPETRLDLMGNRLVVVTPRAAPMDVELRTDFPLVDEMNGKPLAMGDPDHVPAGMYAKAALQTVGLWEALENHIAPMHHVRAALVLVERGEAAAGIVYATDAATSSRVSVAATFSADSHPPILYPAAIVAGRSRPEVERFFDYLTSAEAMTIFTRHGFGSVRRMDR